MKIKLFYFYNTGYVMDEEKHMEVTSIDWRGAYQGDRVFIQELEVDVPDCDVPSKEELANGMIEVLKEQKKSILAETHRKVSAIDERIQQLLCLDNKE